MNEMSRQEILDAILPLNDPKNGPRRLQWLINLGYQMTISARAGYPTVENKIEHLVAFNELQHQLYNQMLHCQTNDEWYKVEELLENLRNYAVAAGVGETSVGRCTPRSALSLTGSGFCWDRKSYAK